MSLSYAAMAGVGAREAAFFRWVFQRGLEVIIAEKFARSGTFDAYS